MYLEPPQFTHTHSLNYACFTEEEPRNIIQNTTSLGSEELAPGSRVHHHTVYCLVFFRESLFAILVSLTGYLPAASNNLG